ncbi:hypothetical protein [Aliivibrio sp. EL58]|uniref:hypothetical protein n=1 Tax=Aliivibrio sp. EL58 TaxID=2107582 RepID=UPI000EFB16CE|nr:hypothetical protein [Aliivibrio sp. EL58]
MKNKPIYFIIFYLLLLTGCDLTEEEPVIVNLTFHEQEVSLPLGRSYTLKVNTLLSDGSVTEISDTSNINFIISDENIALFKENEQNVLLGQNIGMVSITASGTFDASEYQSVMKVKITNPTIRELAIESIPAEIIVGVPVVLQVTATLSDGSKVSVTNNSELEWEVNKSDAVTLTSSDEGMVIRGDKEGEVKVTVSIGSSSSIKAHSTFIVTPKNYVISVSNNSVSQISRSMFEGYDLDDVQVRHNYSTNFDLLNTTPRYLNNPLVKVNQQYFRMDSFIYPFQAVNFKLPEWFDEQVTSAYFVEEQPLFKANVRAYADIKQDDDKYAQPTEENVYQYEKELRAFKLLMNNYDYNFRFISFIDNYMNSKLRSIKHEGHWCEVEELTQIPHSFESSSDDFTKFRGNDTSPNTLKHVSLIANKPSATYMMLTRTSNGVATIGDGWLSVRDFRLFTEGATAPKTTYLHEKMHNHGFGHSGGMTYGYPAETGTFVNHYWRDFYEDKAVEISTSTIASNYKFEDLGTQFKFEVSFLDKAASNIGPRSIDKFILLTTSLPKLKESYFIDNSSKAIRIFPEEPSVYEGTYTFKDINNLNTLSINETNSEATPSKLVFIFDKPEQAIINDVPASLTFIGGSEKDNRQQANLIVGYSGASGFATVDNEYIYLFKNREKNDNGIFTREAQLYSPSEAEMICKNKGLNLGILKPFRSDEMMEFQSKYQIYGSQVGISYETGLPIAISVPTTYRPSSIKEVDKGALIICSQ